MPKLNIDAAELKRAVERTAVSTREFGEAFKNAARAVAIESNREGATVEPKVKLNLTTVRGALCFDTSGVSLTSLFASEIKYVARITGRHATYLFDREFLKRARPPRTAGGTFYSTRNLSANDHLEIADVDKAKRYFIVESIAHDAMTLINSTKANTLVHAAALDGDQFGEGGEPERVDDWIDEPEPFADHEYDDEGEQFLNEKKPDEFIVGSVDDVRAAFQDKEEGDE